MRPLVAKSALRHPPRREVVLLVDADGLSSAVPLVVVEEPSVLGAHHVVMSVRLHCRGWGGWGGVRMSGTK